MPTECTTHQVDRNVKISNPVSKVLILEGNTNFFLSINKISNFKFQILIQKKVLTGLTSQGETIFEIRPVLVIGFNKARLFELAFDYCQVYNQ